MGELRDVKKVGTWYRCRLLSPGECTPLNRTIPTPRARRTSSFRVVRSSIGLKLGQGTWTFRQGDKLEGMVMTHPVNAYRKVVISTELGTFNLNEEDIEIEEV